MIRFTCIDKVLEYINQNFHSAAFSDAEPASPLWTAAGTLPETFFLLLIDTTQSVSEVAYNCDFNNKSSFNHHFKKK